MTVADEHLAQIDPVLGEWGGDVPSWLGRDLAECVRWEPAAREALRPMMGVVISLTGSSGPGTDRMSDVSLAAQNAFARRAVLANSAVGIDYGFAQDSLQLLGRLDALIGADPDPDRDAPVRQRVQELVDARARGRERGRMLRRRHGDRGESAVSAGWLLRHPADHWLRVAASAVLDPVCRSLLEARIAKLAPSYAKLSALDSSDAEAEADVVCEMHVLDACRSAWKAPMKARVASVFKGAVRMKEQVGVWLVTTLTRSSTAC